MTFDTNIWLWIVPVLRLWIRLAVRTLAPFATLAYEEHDEANFAYDGSRESAFGYGAVPERSMDERRNGATGEDDLFTKFATFLRRGHP